MSLRGSVDSLDVEGASGWIFDGDRGRPVVVQAMLDGRVIGEAPAELPRPDLASAGLGDGRCGFQIAFYDAVDPGLLPFVAVRPQGGDVELPRTNLTGFGEYFRALHARFPGGRAAPQRLRRLVDRPHRRGPPACRPGRLRSHARRPRPCAPLAH